jgi:hypothetical protein
MTDKLNWDNFDKVSDLIEMQVEKTDDSQKLKDANEALGQLLGVTDNPVYQKMTTEQKNMFLQFVRDTAGKSSSDTAQKVLQGLHLRAAPSAPRMAPSMTLAPPTPGGMGGGGSAPRANIPAHLQEPEDDTPPWLKPVDEDDK